MLVAFNKPYGVLSQFTPEPGSRWRTLAGFALPPQVYPIGRLDADSEGLLLLTDEAALVERLLDPKRGHPRGYFAQVERIPAADALARLADGVVIGGYKTLPCRVRRLAAAPPLPPRDPPVRYRKNVSDCWLALELTEGKNRQVRRMTAAIGHPLELTEGKNRQVRRMTAAIGHPTLRLVRMRIGRLELPALALKPGDWRKLDEAERQAAGARG
ncbi:pseudouridine synthase [Termitidicoccus mucosus]|uniref:pseudouridine synthase n=1 Tax=Termitidicoccus mucosus TaxID=1184151 RepID=UPI0031832EE8